MAKVHTPGPTADRLKLDGDWKKALKKAIAVERPPEGFPDPAPRYKARKAQKKATSAKKRKA